jgi:hypothetical protein
MSMSRRVLVVGTKAIKLGALVLVTRCFGNELTAHMLASLGVMRHRLQAGGWESTRPTNRAAPRGPLASNLTVFTREK